MRALRRVLIAAAAILATLFPSGQSPPEARAEGAAALSLSARGRIGEPQAGTVQHLVLLGDDAPRLIVSGGDTLRVTPSQGVLRFSSSSSGAVIYAR